jgi:exportin-7
MIGRCSLYGLWSNATVGGKTLQLCTLDFDTQASLQDFPVVTIYHPRSTKLCHAFANVSWADQNSFHRNSLLLLISIISIEYIGALTGMSSTQMGISEIGIYFY